MASTQARSPLHRVAAALARGCRGYARGRTLSQALRLRRPWRYLGSELLRRRGARRYELRGSAVHVLVRHGTSDVTTFDEVFCSSAYVPPPLVAAALDGLGRPPRVIDLGANVGLFSAFCLGRWPGAQITAFEPDPGSLMLLRCVAEHNRHRGDIVVVEAAAGASDGTMRFVAGLAAESHRAHPDEHVETIEVRTIDVLEQIAEADFVKVDIEGGEWELLGDARLARGGPCVLVLEHHGRHCPTNDPRATAMRQLRAAGFEVQAAGPAVNGVGVLWAWRGLSRAGP